MADEDHFADVRQEIAGAGFGALGGEGIEHHDSAKSKVAASGVETKCRCERCGALNVITVEWTELAILSQSRLPQGWLMTAGLALPHLGCRNCKEQVRTGFTPDEASRHLRAGIAGGKVSEADVQRLIAQIRQTPG